MPWKRSIRQLLKLVFTLWLTVSFVFAITRLLPSAQKPKGLQDSDLATYGLSDAAVLSTVTKDYQKRAGHHLPLFYIEVQSTGKLKAYSLVIDSIDQAWVQQGVLWKGLPATRAFYPTWQAYSQTITKKQTALVRKHFLNWASSGSLREREKYQDKIYQLLLQGSVHNTNFLKRWQNLQAAEAPLHYYLPQFKWNGLQNAYHLWIQNLLTGDLGVSTMDYEPVFEKIAAAALISFSIAILGLIAGLLITYYAGLYFTLYPTAVFTRISHLFLYFLDSIPAFLIALGLYALWLSWADLTSGYLFGDEPDEASLFQLWAQASILMGGFCIVLFILPHLTLQFNRSLQFQYHKLYLRTALAKGLSPRRALQIHALPNALGPSMTLVSEVIIGLMAGVLVIEITFSLPGIGSLLTKSILTADYPVLIGLTLFFLLFRVVVIWITEMIMSYLDPRQKTTQ